MIEQIDGADLAALAAPGTVWTSGNGTVETERAILTGRRVAREATTNPRGARVIDGIRLIGSDLLTVAQRDRRGSWSSRPSGRVSLSGRYVEFVSSARLLQADTNGVADVYLLDLETGQITLESIGSHTGAADGWSANPDVSGDGRYVVFESVAGNLTERPLMSGFSHVYLRDRTSGTTCLLTVNANGTPADGASRHATMSADGSAVVFESTATNLLHTNEGPHGSVGIYLLRLAAGQVTRVDVDSDGQSHAEPSMHAALSADGRFVAFASKADMLCGGRSGCITHLPDRRGRRESTCLTPTTT